MARTFKDEEVSAALLLIRSHKVEDNWNLAVIGAAILIVDAIERTMEREPLALDALATKVKHGSE